MDNLELMLEADKRGLLPPEQKALLGEAIKRGLVQTPGATSDQKFRASGPMRFAQGLRDPIDAGAQLAPFVLGGAATLGKGITSLGGLVPNPVSDLMGKGADAAFGEFDRVNQGVKEAEQKLQTARKATGQDGVDAFRLTGNILSPANLALSPAVAPAATAVKTGATKMAIGGGVQGAAGAAATPVEDAENGADFALKKGLQVATGTATGAVAGPVVGKLLEAVVPKVSALLTKVPVSQRSEYVVNQTIAEALKEAGQKAEDLPATYMQALKNEVAKSLQSGKLPDVASMTRKADFERVGIPTTTGQITRDPMQFAREQNLRAVPGVGDPLTNLFNSQDKGISQALGKFGGSSAQELTPASHQVHSALKGFDESLRKQVSAAYAKARESSGKDMDIPLQGLAQDVATVLNDFAEKVPGGVKNKLAEYGLLGGKQTRVFTFDDAEKVLKNINDHVGSDAATNKALDNLRTAVKRAVTEAPGDDVFAGARKLAAQRFKLHEVVPALEAAANGRASPDEFVQKFIINGKPTDVKGIASVLKNTDKGAFDEARNQIGAKLYQAAFGANAAGDKAAAQERFALELKRIGTEKLSAFFSKQEIDQIKTLGRVMAYVHSKPSAAPVMGNPNMAWAGNMLASQVGGKPLSLVGNALGRVVSGGMDARNVNNALSAKVPEAMPSMTPEQLRTLVNVRRLAPLLAGGAAASSLGQ
jgi:hypothetical protein